MTEAELQRNRRCFELAGALICGISVGFLQAALYQDSMTPPRYSDLIQFTLDSLACYLITFLLTKKYWAAPLNRMVPNWLIIAIVGATLSAHLSGLLLANEVKNLHRVWILSGLLGAWSLLIMGFVSVMGFMVRLLRKEIEYQSVIK